MKKITSLDVYNLSEELSDRIWVLYDKWSGKAQNTMGYQIIRSADSIAANIAEGYGRKTTRQYIYGLYLANGSLCELETQLMLSQDLGYCDSKDFKSLKNRIDEISRMLRALIKALEPL